MAFIWITLVIGLALLAFLLFVKYNGGSSLQAFIKTGVSVCFLLIAIMASYRIDAEANVGKSAIFIIAALLFALLGDIWLDLMLMHRKYEDLYMKAGFVSFTICHLFIIISLIVRWHSDAKVLYFIIPVILGIAIGILVGQFGNLLRVDYGNCKFFVIVYSAVLISAVLLSLSLCIACKFASAALVLLFIGELLVLISDLILNQIYFGSHWGDNLYTTINLAVYYVGAYLISFSILAIK